MLTDHNSGNDKDVVQKMAAFAEGVATLFIKEPGDITPIDQVRAAKDGEAAALYTHTVQLKNAICTLFSVMTRGLVDADDREPKMIITKDGNVIEDIMRAISFRFIINLTTPEFSIPFAKAIKHHVASGHKVATNHWQLEDGEQQSVYIRAIGEKEAQPPRQPRTRARAVKFQISMPT